MSETFLYYRPNPHDADSHLVRGHIPQYFGYSSFGEFLSKALEVDDRGRTTLLTRDFFSDVWDFNGEFSLVGSVLVRDVRVKGEVAYFKMCGPVKLACKQVLKLTNILVHETQVNLGDVEFNARSAVFVPEKLVPTLHRLRQQRASINAEWREFVKQCAPK